MTVFCMGVHIVNDFHSYKSPFILLFPNYNHFGF
jgi:hypothetical protein